MSLCLTILPKLRKASELVFGKHVTAKLMCAQHCHAAERSTNTTRNEDRKLFVIWEQRGSHVTTSHIWPRNVCWVTRQIFTSRGDSRPCYDCHVRRDISTYPSPQFLLFPTVLVACGTRVSSTAQVHRDLQSVTWDQARDPGLDLTNSNTLVNILYDFLQFPNF